MKWISQKEIEDSCPFVIYNFSMIYDAKQFMFDDAGLWS